MYGNARPHKRPLCQRGARAETGGLLAVGGRFRGGIWGRGNPSGRARWRGHLPLTREANGGGGPRPTGEPHLCGIASPCRGPCAAAMSPGGPWPSPTNHGKRLRPKGLAVTAGAAVGAGCPHPAGPHGGANIPVLTRCGAAGRERPALQNAGNTAANQRPCAAANTRGRDKSLPYDQRRAHGQPGNRRPCVITNLCRGRCLALRPQARFGGQRPQVRLLGRRSSRGPCAAAMSPGRAWPSPTNCGKRPAVYGRPPPPLHSSFLIFLSPFTLLPAATRPP